MIWKLLLFVVVVIVFVTEFLFCTGHTLMFYVFYVPLLILFILIRLYIQHSPLALAFVFAFAHQQFLKFCMPFAKVFIITSLPHLYLLHFYLALATVFELLFSFFSLVLVLYLYYSIIRFRFICFSFFVLFFFLISSQVLLLLFHSVAASSQYIRFC